VERHCPRCERSFPDGSRCPHDGTELVILDAADDLVGKEISGRYTLKRKLGAGGMGAVYIAWQHSVGRDVAVKIVHPKIGRDAEAAKRFLREVKLASRLSQPNTVSVYDFGQTEDGQLYFAMELLRGRPLNELRNEPFPPERVVRIGVQLCDALEAAHRLEIVHRDLKPANILVLDDPPGRDLLKVLDFGLAKSLNEAEDTAVTRSGALLGTPSYMPPEAVRGEPSDARGDLYSLGVILAELASGKLPFRASSVNEMLRQQLDATPEISPSLPAPLKRVLMRLMAKSPQERYASASVAREMLLAALRAEPLALDATADVAAAAPTPNPATPNPATPVPPTPSPIPAPSIRSWLVAALPLLVCAGTFALGYGGVSARDPRSWMHYAGPPAYAIPVLLILSVAAALLERRLAAWWFALACPLVGGVVLELSQAAVRYHTAARTPATRFQWFAVGVWQANHALFLGFAGGCAAFLALAATYAGERSRNDRNAALALAALGVIALGAGVPDGAFAAFIAAFALWLPRDHAAGRAAGLLAVAMALLLVGFARPVARDAWLWLDDSTRAARAASIMALAASRWKLNAFLGAVAAVLIAVEIARGAFPRPSRSGWAIAAALAVIAIGETVQHFRIVAERADLYSAMAPQFALFSRLDPPSAEGLAFTPSGAPALQLGRDTLSIDGVVLAKLSSLDSSDGQLVLVRELQRTLAAPRERNKEDPDLLVAADRSLPYRDVLRALRLARHAGVQHVEVLLTRGAAPILPDDAPAEAGYALASDFFALPFTLTPGRANPEELAKKFGEVTPALIELARKGPAPLAVDEEAPRDDLAGARAMFNAGQIKSALEEIDTHLRAHPDDTEALSLAAQIACKLGDKAVAETYLGALLPAQRDAITCGLKLDPNRVNDAGLSYRVKVLYRTQLLDCYHAALVKRPKLHGKSVLKFQILNDGSIVDLAVSGTDQELDACVRAKFDLIRGWKFGRPTEGGVIMVGAPIIFGD
jgi:tRNA A-37 threonylcarbamoyl transferase component Bud32